MKRLFAHLTQSRYRVYFLCSLVLLIFLSAPLYAQGPLSDWKSFNKARKYYEKASSKQQRGIAVGARDWLDAAMYLTAYIERDPDAMQKESEHRNQVKRALEHCIDEIEKLESTCKKECPDVFRAPSGVRGPADTRGVPPPLDPVPAQTDTSAPPEHAITPHRAPPAPDPTSTPTPRSYPLVCRGGGDLVFSYAASSSFSNKPHIRVTFEKATFGVGTNAENILSLGAGQCSFIDRGVRPNEPSSIVIGYPVLQPDEFSISWTRQGAIIDLDRGLDYLHNLKMETADYESFQVYNDGNGNFVVTKRGFVIGFLEVASGRDYQIAHEGLTSGLTAGARVYTDSDFIYTSVPSFLEGATYILTAMNDKLIRGDDEFLSFRTNRATTVYVAHDDRYTTKPAWLNSFRKRSENLVLKSGRSSITLSLFERTFPGGEITPTPPPTEWPGATSLLRTFPGWEITLGSNVVPAETENNGMYTVIIKKSE